MNDREEDEDDFAYVGDEYKRSILDLLNDAIERGVDFSFAPSGLLSELLGELQRREWDDSTGIWGYNVCIWLVYRGNPGYLEIVRAAGVRYNLFNVEDVRNFNLAHNRDANHCFRFLPGLALTAERERILSAMWREQIADEGHHGRTVPLSEIIRDFMSVDDEAYGHQWLECILLRLNKGEAVSCDVPHSLGVFSHPRYPHLLDSLRANGQVEPDEYVGALGIMGAFRGLRGDPRGAVELFQRSADARLAYGIVDFGAMSSHPSSENWAELFRLDQLVNLPNGEQVRALVRIISISFSDVYYVNWREQPLRKVIQQLVSLLRTMQMEPSDLYSILREVMRWAVPFAVCGGELVDLTKITIGALGRDGIEALGVTIETFILLTRLLQETFEETVSLGLVDIVSSCINLDELKGWRLPRTMLSEYMRNARLWCRRYGLVDVRSIPALKRIMDIANLIVWMVGVDCALTIRVLGQAEERNPITQLILDNLPPNHAGQAIDALHFRGREMPPEIQELVLDFPESAIRRAARDPQRWETVMDCLKGLQTAKEPSHRLMFINRLLIVLSSDEAGLPPPVLDLPAPAPAPPQ